MSINKQRTWEQQSDTLLVYEMIQAYKNGTQIKKAIKRSSEMLGRTENACKTRWSKYLSKIHAKEVKNAKKIAEVKTQNVPIKNGFPTPSLDFELLDKLLNNEGTSIVGKTALDVYNSTRYMMTRVLEIVRTSNGEKNEFIVLDRGDDPSLKFFKPNYDVPTETIMSIVRTDGKKIIDCDCKDPKKALAYMMKVAIERNLEIF